MMSNRDAEPLERMIRILKPYEAKGKPVLYIFNRWNRRFNIVKDFITWFHTKYPNLHTAVLCDSTQFNIAGAYRQSIFDYQKACLGARQIGEIYGVVKYHLNIKEKWRTK